MYVTSECLIKHLHGIHAKLNTNSEYHVMVHNIQHSIGIHKSYIVSLVQELKMEEQVATPLGHSLILDYVMPHLFMDKSFKVAKACKESKNLVMAI